MNEKRANWLPIIALLTAMVVWGSSFVALKVAFRTYDPMVVIFGRMFVGGLCFLFLRHKFGAVRYQAGDWKPLLLLAACEPCMYFIFESWALVNTTASQAGMITSILPLLVAMAAWFFLGERTSRRTVAGFLTAIAGTIWLSMAGEATADAPNPALGNFLEFVAMLCATGYTILVKRLSHRYSALFITAVQAWVGTVFFFPLMFLPPTDLPTAFEMTPVLAILYLGVVVTLGGYACYNYGVTKIPASQASAFVNLIPVFSIAMGWAVLGETLTVGQYMACLLVFAGVFWSQDPGTRRKQNGKTV